MLELCGNTTTGKDSKCIAINRELEVDVLHRSAEHHLSVGHKPTRHAACVSRAEEIVKDRDVLSRVVDVVGMTDSHVCNAGPIGR